MGMISHITSADEYEAVLTDVLRSVSGGPTLAFGWTKRALAAATLAELEPVQAIEAEGSWRWSRPLTSEKGTRLPRTAHPKFSW